MTNDFMKIIEVLFKEVKKDRKVVCLKNDDMEFEA